jgi:metallo-beta-lactamase class B
MRLIVALIICTSQLVAAQPKLEINHLTTDFYIFTTYQAYKGTIFPANGMYVVTSGGVILIDSPWDTTQFQPLLDSIQKRHQMRVVLALATHSHEDRTAGLEFLKARGVKTYTSRLTDKISRKDHQKRAEFLFQFDTTFTVGQHSFEAFYPGPGHTEDNIVVWFPATRLLYGGCLIKSVEARNLGNLADADVVSWPGTLGNIKKRYGEFDYVIPGHQKWTDNTAVDHTLLLLKNK